MKINKTNSFSKSLKARQNDSSAKVGLINVDFKQKLDSLSENYDDNQSSKQAYSPKDWSENILSCLDKIKLDIIDGKLSKNDLEKLQAACSSRITKTDDPALIEILQEVKLRAVIELAKYS